VATIRRIISHPGRLTRRFRRTKRGNARPGTSGPWNSARRRNCSTRREAASTQDLPASACGPALGVLGRLLGGSLYADYQRGPRLCVVRPYVSASAKPPITGLQKRSSVSLRKRAARSRQRVDTSGSPVMAAPVSSASYA
jgi:hypothetical protein